MTPNRDRACRELSDSKQLSPYSDTHDPMAQLTKLGEMRPAGLLTGAEFTAAKARLPGQGAFTSPGRLLSPRLLAIGSHTDRTRLA